MRQRSSAKIAVLPGPDIDLWPSLWQSFERGLRAGSGTKSGKAASPRTIEIYSDGGRAFYEWSKLHNLPTDPKEITKPQVEDFLIHLRRERKAKPATVRARFSALRRFFNWCVEEGEAEHSPMERMHGVKVDEPVTPILSEDELARLLKACKGDGFEDKRDLAIISLMIDTGLRRQEVAGIQVEDVDLAAQTIAIRRRKGGMSGVVYIGAQVVRDLDRYLRVRPRHRNAGLSAMWLAPRGELSGDGLHHLVARRARMAGLEGVHPHTMRHVFADALKRQGASDEDVMTLGGWSDAKTMRRYGRSAAQARARETHRRLSPRDRI